MYFGPALTSQQQYQLPSGYPPSEPQGQFHVGSIVSTLLRRKRLFLAILAGFLGIVVLFTALVPKTYTATIKLIAGATGGGDRTGVSALPLLNALLAASTAQSSETYVDLIQEDPVVLEVIRNLKLDMSVHDVLKKVVNVKPVTNSSIIELDATWGDRSTAAKIANEFGNVFVNRERQLIAGQAGAALDFLTQQMPVAEDAMRKADEQLARFEAAHPNVYVSVSDTGATTDSAVLQAQQKYAQLEVDAQQAQAQLASVRAQLATTSPTINGSSDISQNPVAEQLRTQLAQVEVQYQQALKQYTPQHPAVIALKEQKEQLERELRDQPATIVNSNSIVPNPVYQQLNAQAVTLQSQIAGDKGQLESLSAELGHMSGTQGSLPAATMQLATLQRNAKMAEDVYTALQQKYSEATVAKTTALSDVAITQPASPGDVAIKPSWLINLILGLVLGLALATSGVFAVEFFDNTFKDEEDVRRTLSLPLLTTVPQLTTKAPKKLPWLRALTVEAFLQFVSALRYSSDKPLRSLAITSPNQGDGKSTVAMSTAIAMAEMEPQIVLIDADLRQPSLHDKLGASAQPGLSEYLVGAARLDEVVQPTKYDGLHVITSGARVPNPMKLLHSSRLDELIAELLKTYRAVIFDTPALLPVYDAAVLAAKVDGAVMVIAAGTTGMPATKKALQRLESASGVNLLGVILNRATPSNGYASYYLNTDSPMPLPHEDGVAAGS